MKNNEKVTNKIGLSKYLKENKLGVFLYVLLNVVSSSISIFLTLFLAKAIEYVTNSAFEDAIYMFFICLVFYFVRRILWYFLSRVYYIYSTRIMASLNYDLANQAFKLNSETYSNYETGTFVQRIISDPERVVENMANIVDMITDIVTSFIILLYISTINVYLGLCLLFIIVVSTIIEKYRIRKYRVNRIATRKASDKIHSLTTEIVRSEKDIKSIGLEEKLSEVSKVNYDGYKKLIYKTNIVDIKFWTLKQILIEIGTVLTLILGIVLIDKGLLTFASFMIIYSNNNSLYGLIWQLGHIVVRFSEIKIASNRMFALFDNNKFECEHFGDIKKDDITGNIQFKNVCYSYKEYEKEEEERIFKDKTSDNKNEKLKSDKKKNKNKTSTKRKIISTNKIFENLNFEIKPNTTVAFVGKSGSGKSTILNLMSKMYVVDSGEVLIDGININDFDKPSLRKAISLVNQFPYIFDMTIKENLLLAKKDATDEEINKAIKDAAFDDFVATLKNGINTKVGESGVKLSGGQKQRLAIARALLRNSSIIIFDESTSSLDNFAQESIKKSIDNLKGKSTIVIVAHRLSTIKNVDTIFFLDEGKIIDQGSFEELFNKNEKFKNMFLAENI